jgi:hypothetical protein
LFFFGCCSLISRWDLRTAICPISDSILLPAHSQSFCLSRLCLLKVCVEISSFILPPSLVYSDHHPLCCMFLFCSLFIIQVFLWGGVQSVQGAMLVLPRGSCGNTTCYLFAHLLVCVSQAALEPASGGAGAFLFSQCNVVWRNFVRVKVLILLVGFYSAKCGYSISAKFLIYRAHTVCFCPLVAILDPLALFVVFFSKFGLSSVSRTSVYHATCSMSPALCLSGALMLYRHFQFRIDSFWLIILCYALWQRNLYLPS